jgi:RNA polymerase sigma-70 factor (ECF subfamily)
VREEQASDAADLRRLAVAWRERADEAAARELMSSLYPQVSAIIRRHYPRRTGEEDMAQKIFVRLFTKLDRYDESLPLENWVARLALNACLDELRAERRRPELRWADLSEEQAFAMESLLATEVDDARGGAPETGSGELLRRLLDTLGAEDRLVITLLMLEEKSVAEVAALTGWNKTLVKVRAFRARQKLKRALAALEESRP